LRAAGLDVRTGQGLFSSTVPVGIVIDSRPLAGAKIRKGAAVFIVPSLGPELRPVPDVVGLAEGEAKKTIKDAGFMYDITRAYDDNVKKGTVIRQNPAADVKLEKGKRITITISRGLAPVEVPSVKGMIAAVAKATLEAKGFKVKQSEDFSTTVPKGKAIGTDPPAGTEQPVGSEIDLIVSKGPRSFAMPNVKGMKTDAATKELKDLGLRVTVHKLGAPFDGTVVQLQSPAPGTAVHVGDTVEIWV
jgi:serine/threonine-protein kinase